MTESTAGPATPAAPAAPAAPTAQAAGPGTGTELGRYLRARRARVTPAEAGLPAGTGLRRTPGLRREELATLAGVSVDYYTRLERGRETNPSPSVIDALARALRLTRRRPRAPARPGGTGLRPPHGAAPHGRAHGPRLRPAHAGRVAPLPAYVVSRHSYMLAANAARPPLCPASGTGPTEKRNVTPLPVPAPRGPRPVPAVGGDRRQVGGAPARGRRRRHGLARTARTWSANSC